MSQLSLDSVFLTAAPLWFRNRAQEAWAQYQELPVPGVRDEAWRYSNAKRVPIEAICNAALPSQATLETAVAASAGLAEVSAKFVFVNNQLALASEQSLPAGVVVGPLAQVLQSHSEVLEKHFMQQKMALGSAKFAALHLAMVKSGVVVIVPKGVEVAAPIEVFHFVSGENASIYPHTLVIAEDLAAVTVVDHYRSLEETAGFSLAVSDLVAGAGSKVTYIACQEMSQQAQAMHLSSSTAGRDSMVKAFQLQLGANWSRSESVSDLVGSGARSDMLSVSLPLGDQVVDQRTLQNHKAPHSYSDLLYKNALYDESRTIFSGLITVDEGAHFTDAYQTCRNLLNSLEAEANSMPGLEINADQVKCSHGSTSGPVDSAELFYLMARGIPEGEARKLIVMGFADDVISRIGNEAIETMIHSRVEEKFARVAA
jgi:Fe-S cluster assembly protein SufD